jgi:hypothetical protein
MKRIFLYRLYLDEVGTDVLTNVAEDNHRFLSLSGVILSKPQNRDVLVPSFDRMKAEIFDHDPDHPLIFHRKEIAQFKGRFVTLRDHGIRERFDAQILGVIRDLDFKIITVTLDKQWMLRQGHWQLRHPYHYLMEVMVEKFVQLLERFNSQGDIMPEARQGKPDKSLQAAFLDVRENGTRYCEAARICERIPSKNLKFRRKPENIAGIQLCDLLAHPSHMNIRNQQGHAVEVGPFAQQILKILNENKYDRSYHGRINGYGTKYFG